MNPLSQIVYKGLCKSWSLKSLGNIHKVKKDLKALGFKNIKIQNIWYRVAPSVLHVPFVIVNFILNSIVRKKKLSQQSIDNLKGSFYALLSGLCLGDFGYYSIQAEK